MNDHSTTFEAVTSSMLKILKEDFSRTDSTLEGYAWKWNQLRQFMENNDLHSLTPQVCDDFLSSLYGSKDLTSLKSGDKKFLSAILLLKNYLITGQVIPRKVPVELKGEIGSLMMQYILSRSQERLSGHTIYNHKQIFHRFLDFLTSAKVASIEQVEITHIIKYLNTIGTKYKSVASISIHILRNFFRYLYEHKIIDMDLAAFIPKDNYKKQPKLPSAYTSEEIKKIVSSVDRSTTTGKRNYSIILLATMLGLRASDIANLKFENILWEDNAIRLIQHKTNKELELPLLPEIGNAIIEYLRYGRPKSQSSYIFLLARSPYTHINQPVISQIAKKYFLKANVNIKNKHHGAHALRHSLATLLLEEQVKLPVISEVLGHENTESTSYYLRIDIQSLKKCSLDVSPVCENFYTQKGGYFYE